MSLFKNIKFLDTIKPKLISIINNSVDSSVLETRNQVTTIQSVLDNLDPVIEFIKHPDKNKMVGLLPYTVAVVTILSLSAIVFGIVWSKREPLNTFVKTQFDKLTKWTQEKYLSVSKRKLEREQRRQLERQARIRKEEEEKRRLEEEAKIQTWSSYFTNKIQGIVPRFMDPTNKASWVFLSGMWTQYMSGLSNVSFNAIIVATVAKFAVFVAYLIRTFIRAEIYGEEYDPLFVRLPEALLTSFLDLLHLQLKKVKLSDEIKTDDVRINELKNHISQLEEARKALREEIVNLSPSKQSTPTKLAQRVQSVKKKQLELDHMKHALLETIDSLVGPKPYNLKPLLSTEFSGGKYETSFFGTKNFVSNDSIYLKVWISLADNILSFVNSQEQVTTELYKLAKLNDNGTYPKQKGYPGFPNEWNRFLMKQSELMGTVWTNQRDELLNLRKFITIYILAPSKEIVEGVKKLNASDDLKFGVPVAVLKSLDSKSPVKRIVDDDNNGDEEEAEFYTPKSRSTPQSRSTQSKINLLREFTSDRDRQSLKEVKTALEKELPKQTTIERKNQELETLILKSQEIVSAIQSSAETKQNDYINTVANMFKRHQQTIRMSKVACQLLKYFVALRDAYDTSVALYMRNKSLTLTSKDFFNDSRNFFKIIEIYNQLDNSEDYEEIKTTEFTISPSIPLSEKDNYVSYEKALGMLFTPFELNFKNRYPSLLQLLKDYMCQIYHITEKLDNVHPNAILYVKSDLSSIKSLYDIQSQCSEHAVCVECECDKVDNVKNIKIPEFKQHIVNQHKPLN